MITVGSAILVGEIFLRPEHCRACGEDYLAAEDGCHPFGILESVCGKCRREALAATWAAKVEAKGDELR